MRPSTSLLQLRLPQLAAVPGHDSDETTVQGVLQRCTVREESLVVWM